MVLGAKYYGVIPEDACCFSTTGNGRGAREAGLAHPTENYAPGVAHAKGMGDVVALLGYYKRSCAPARDAVVVEPALEAPWINFAAARRMVQPHLSEDAAIAAVFDLHRDALEGRPDGHTTVMIDRLRWRKSFLSSVT